MFKILQINSVINTGSTGRIIEEIGNSIQENGWESYIAFGRYGNESTSKSIRIGNRLSNYLHVVLTRIFDKHGLGSKIATKRFIRRIEKIKPDLIHLHNIHGYYLNISLLFSYLSKASIPVVWTLHDCWSFTGHCVHFEAIKCSKWKSGCVKCPQKTSYPSSQIFDNSKANYEIKNELFNSLDNLTLVPVSYWLQDLIKSSFLRKNELLTIQNGIDLSVFKKTDSQNLIDKLCLENKTVLLGVASVWNQGKGLDDFLKLSGLIDDDEIIVLVGLHKNQITGLPENVIGIERTESREELSALYGLADVFLNLTYGDTFPTTNLEALACGTPVITYNTGGSPEAISEHTGIVVDQGDLKGVLDGIIEIRRNGKDYFEKACIERAESFFDKNQCYLKYINLYEGLLSH